MKKFTVIFTQGSCVRIKQVEVKPEGDLLRLLAKIVDSDYIQHVLEGWIYPIENL
jgi:hypothetical protein